MNAVRVKDLKTGNIGFFNRQNEALGWIRKLSKRKTNSSCITASIKLNRPIYGRFEISVIPREKAEKVAKPMTHTKKVDGWDFWQGEKTPTVLVAEKRLNFYDNDQFQAVTDTLKPLGYIAYFDTTNDENMAKKRLKARVEIYRKFDADVLFDKKIEQMLEVLNNVPCLGVEQ